MAYYCITSTEILDYLTNFFDLRLIFDEQPTPRDRVHPRALKTSYLKNARITFGSNTPPLPLCGQAQDLTLLGRGYAHTPFAHD